MRIEKSTGLVIGEIVTQLLICEFANSDRKGAEHEYVSVGVFTNCRECGHTYKVMAENDKTFTWCVYEHKNSDSIIINGKEGYISIAGDLPYCSDNKWEFLASFGFGEYQKTAQKLRQLIEKFLDNNTKGDSE